jgi:hypothetical protein
MKNGLTPNECMLDEAGARIALARGGTGVLIRPCRDASQRAATAPVVIRQFLLH